MGKDPIGCQSMAVHLKWKRTERERRDARIRCAAATLSVCCSFTLFSYCDDDSARGWGCRVTIDGRWKRPACLLPFLVRSLSLRTQNGKKKRIQSLSLSLSPHLFSPSSPSSSSSTGIPVTHSGHAQVERPPRRMKREREKKLSRTREEKDFSSSFFQI